MQDASLDTINMVRDQKSKCPYMDMIRQALDASLHILHVYLPFRSCAITALCLEAICC